MNVILDREPEQQEKVKRPVLITIVCVLEALSALVIAYYLVTSRPDLAGRWYMLSFLFLMAVRMVFVAGMWYMKRIAAVAFLLISVVSQLQIVFYGSWRIYQAILPALFALAVLTQIRKMR